MCMGGEGGGRERERAYSHYKCEFVQQVPATEPAVYFVTVCTFVITHTIRYAVHAVLQ